MCLNNLPFKLIMIRIFLLITVFLFTACFQQEEEVRVTGNYKGIYRVPPQKEFIARGYQPGVVVDSGSRLLEEPNYGEEVLPESGKVKVYAWDYQPRKVQNISNVPYTRSVTYKEAFGVRWSPELGYIESVKTIPAEEFLETYTEKLAVVSHGPETYIEKLGAESHGAETYTENFGERSHGAETYIEQFGPRPHEIPGYIEHFGARPHYPETYTEKLGERSHENQGYIQTFGARYHDNQGYVEWFDVGPHANQGYIEHFGEREHEVPGYIEHFGPRPHEVPSYIDHFGGRPVDNHGYTDFFREPPQDDGYVEKLGVQRHVQAVGYIEKLGPRRHGEEGYIEKLLGKRAVSRPIQSYYLSNAY